MLVEDDPIEFLQKLRDTDLSNLDRAVALIWWHSRSDSTKSMDVSSIATMIHDAGYAKQNVSRLRVGLTRDRRTAKADRNGFRIRIGIRDTLDKEFGGFVRTKIVKATDSVIPAELFNGTRSYIETVVYQINASFDCGLFDCTAVMCRRLLETLIIEAYEADGREIALKNSDGNYMMFSGLLNVVESDPKLSMSRNGIAGLKAFKKLGDLSAHNRRFCARKDDIRRIRDGIRIAAEELLHIADLV